LQGKITAGFYSQELLSTHNTHFCCSCLHQISFCPPA